MKNLNEALLMLKNKNEVDGFLKDLCTPAELKALEERWSVAQLLYEDNLSYREIASKLKTSTTTVTRVAIIRLNFETIKSIIEEGSDEKIQTLH